MPTKRRIEEADLQRAVVQFLNLALPDNAVFHHSMNEGKRSGRALRDVKTMGMRKGWPDIEIIFEGFAFFIELKSHKGVVSEHQWVTINRLRHCGARVSVCRSLDEVAEDLEAWGIPLKARAA